ncbi:MAG: hypothetical protein ACK4JB_25355 [Reyranella sp.]
MTEHLEALPAIDANELQTIEVGETADCFWSGPRGVVGGNGTIYGVSPGRLGLEYELSRAMPPPLHVYYNDSIEISLVKDVRPEKPTQWWLECPDCSRSRRSLYFDGLWLCRVCHGLQYASQRMGPARLIAQEMKVTAKIAAGRPKGMHQRTYRALVARSRDLKRRLEVANYPVPNVEVMFRSTFKWGTRRRSKPGDRTFARTS